MNGTHNAERSSSQVCDPSVAELVADWVMQRGEKMPNVNLCAASPQTIHNYVRLLRELGAPYPRTLLSKSLCYTKADQEDRRFFQNQVPSVRLLRDSGSLSANFARLLRKLCGASPQSKSCYWRSVRLRT